MTPLRSSPRDLIVVVGPTASGKTDLAVRLAERIGGEIVTADSVQVYRRFDVGAGKPTPDERRRARHHLLDILDPFEAIDAARWAELADAAIADIRARGAVPIVAGGTFLWVRALLHGLSPAPPADERIRARHREVELEKGRPALHAELSTVDPRAAARLAPNDFVRVSRALEVYELTGKPLSEWHELHGFRQVRHPARLVGVRWTREALSERIARRVHGMLEAGWVDEVRALLAGGYGSARALSSVGYRQIVDALGQESMDGSALEASIVRATRVFARRQRTWLRDQPVEWLEPGATPTLSA